MESVEKAVQAVREQLPGMKLLENEPMSRHSSFRIGGPARALAFPSDVTGMTKLCAILKEHGVAPYMLGNGTNILFPDEGLEDVLLLSTEKLQRLYRMPGNRLYAEAGVPLEVIPMRAYGMCDGAAVIDLALKLIEENKKK